MSIPLRVIPWKTGLAVLGGCCLAAVIIAGASATATARASAAHVPLDHQLCYSAKGSFKKVPTQGVTLFDQFNPDGFAPQIGRKATLLCNPVIKSLSNGTALSKTTNPRAHLVCFPISAPNAQPAPKVRVTNQFGHATLQPGMPNALCLPSWKSLTGPLNIRPTTPPKLNHFTCYPVSRVSGAYKPPAGLRLRDEFTKKSVSVHVNPVPQELCLPAKKVISAPGGTQTFPIINPDRHLLCYRVSTTPIRNPVYVENQFGSTTMTIGTTKWLCLPSTKTVIGHVYWVNYDGGTVKRVPLGGGSVTTLATSQSWPYAVAVDGTHVYWVNSVDGTVNKVLLGGGSVTTLATGQDHPYSVAVNGTHVYWFNFNGGEVNEVPIGGGGVSTLATGQTGPGSVAVDGTNVYWVNANAGTVNEVPLGGGSVTPLATGQYNPVSVAVDGTHVYWVNYNQFGTLNEVPLGGGSVTPLATGQNEPVSVAVDGTHVYWVNYQSGQVNEVPLGGGSVTTLVSGQNGPRSVAVDGTHVYWVNYYGGQVKKVPLGGGSVTTLATGQNHPSSVAVGP